MWTKLSTHRVFRSLLSGLGSIANAFGILAILPLFFALAMSFDAPGSGKHWAHWVFVVTNAVLGPLCLTGALSRKRHYWGLYGFALALFGWIVLILVCEGRFNCR